MLENQHIDIGYPYLYTGIGAAYRNSVVVPIKEEDKKILLSNGNTSIKRELVPLPKEALKIIETGLGLGVPKEKLIVVASKNQPNSLVQVQKSGVVKVVVPWTFSINDIEQAIAEMQTIKNEQQRAYMEKILATRANSIERQKRTLHSKVRTETVRQKEYLNQIMLSEEKIRVSLAQIKVLNNVNEELDVKKELDILNQMIVNGEILSYNFLEDSFIFKAQAGVVFMGEEVYLGNYTVTIQYSDSRGTVSIINDDLTNDASYAHPHIHHNNSNQSICFGNITDTVAKALSNADISGMCQLLVSYLNSYNGQDAYCEINDYIEQYNNYRK